MITTYKDKNKNRYQIITATDGGFWTSVLVRKNGKLIISDMEYSDVLE